MIGNDEYLNRHSNYLNNKFETDEDDPILHLISKVEEEEWLRDIEEAEFNNGEDEWQY